MVIEVKVLGPGCANCRRLYAEAQRAIAQSSAPATLTKVEALKEITSYKILALPALVVDGQVKSAGRVPSMAEITDWLASAAMREELHSKEA